MGAGGGVANYGTEGQDGTGAIVAAAVAFLAEPLWKTLLCDMMIGARDVLG